MNHTFVKFAATAIGFTVLGVLGHVGYEEAFCPIKAAEAKARITAFELKAYEDSCLLYYLREKESVASLHARLRAKLGQ